MADAVNRQAGYAYLLPAPRPKIVRTVFLGEDILIDLDADGRPIGIEWLGEDDWTVALYRAAMAGRLRIS